MRRLDLCPEGTDNENIVILPEHLFVNLIDTELQRRIANTEDMDYDAAAVIKGILGQEPNETKKDWEVEELKGRIYCSIKERTIFQMMENFDEISYKNTMII